MCNDALHVIGLCGLVDKVSLFLKDWVLGRVATTCHIALDMLCQEKHEPWKLAMLPEKPQCHSKISLSPTIDGL